MSPDVLLLEKLARWRPDGRQTLEVNVPETNTTVSITADAVDVIGCRLWEVALRHTGETKPTGDLKARAETVASRLTGLQEPLRLIEVDAPRNVALLRSDKPTHRGETAYYYEMLLHADGAATVRRYESSHEGESRRQQVAYTLTHETLGKFVNDLIA